jgi:hypothetical protein
MLVIHPDSSCLLTQPIPPPRRLRFATAPMMLAPVLRAALVEQMLARSILPCMSVASVSRSVSNSTLPGPQDARKQQSTPPTHGFAAGFASSTEVAKHAPGENSWTKWRTPYGFEQKSTLGPAMYATLGVFGFSMYLNDMIYHPPRIVALFGLMALLMYVRRGF